MGKILVIVESPGKISKIQKILGPDYLVMASVGHIMDLKPKEMSIDFEDSFKPIYIAYENKETVIGNLKKAFKTASDVLLATDEDREGEMIAWSLAYVLGLKKPKRITFNSITEKEIKNAVKNPREIDDKLVDAQKARRVLDRIVGYELSPLLTRNLSIPNLSAGRVQSVVVRLIMDKENDIKSFFEKGAESYFKFKGVFHAKDNEQSFVTSLMDMKGIEEDGIYKGSPAKIKDETEARNLLKKYMQSIFKVANVFDKKSFRNPSPPFTTSTLQQEAFRKFGMNAKNTMMAAQHLYEAGYITYMRTDSTNLSSEAIDNIKDFVTQTYGSNYHQKNVYASKKQNTQEAHEAVRPTDVFKTEVENNGSKLGEAEKKLYLLIWKRAVASQMKPAELNITTVQIASTKEANHFFETSIENIVFLGFLKVYNIQDVDPEDNDENGSNNKNINIPKPGREVIPENITATQEYSKPPSRFNEASLIDKLDPKNLNIGRPSTYAFIINTILERGYVKLIDIPGIEKESISLTWNGDNKIVEDKKTVCLGKEKNKFVPTDLGIMVTDFLIKNFKEIMDYKFTADMEKKLDQIASGKAKYGIVMKQFYNEFHPLVEELKGQKVQKEETELGVHPETGYKIVATTAKFGPVVKMCPEKGKCIYAPIKEPLTIKTITLEDALKLFEYPKYLGKYEGQKVMLNRGKFGFYLVVGDKKMPVESDKISLEEAIVAIKKREPVKTFESETKSYKILDGPYGRYVKVEDLKPPKGRKPTTYNVTLPVDIDVETLTVDKIQEIINNYYTELKAKRGMKKKEVQTGGKKAVPKKKKSAVVKKKKC